MCRPDRLPLPLHWNQCIRATTAATNPTTVPATAAAATTPATTSTFRLWTTSPATTSTFHLRTTSSTSAFPLQIISFHTRSLVWCSSIANYTRTTPTALLAMMHLPRRPTRVPHAPPKKAGVPSLRRPTRPRTLPRYRLITSMRSSSTT